MATTAVVTGANKGIGFEIVRSLAKSKVGRVILTARDEERGKVALDTLSGEGLNNVEFHQLDIRDSSSIENFAQYVGSKYGSLDILINNAGIAYKGNAFGVEEAKITLNTNYKGTQNICEALEPLLLKSSSAELPRIVNVASMAGTRRNVTGKLRRELDELLDREDASAAIGELEQFFNAFPQAVKAGNHSQNGWSNSMYGISKLAEMSYTVLLAKKYKDKILITGCCPGYCATDMSSWRGYKTAAEGADTPVWLALAPKKSINPGQLYQERKPYNF